MTLTGSHNTAIVVDLGIDPSTGLPRIIGAGGSRRRTTTAIRSTASGIARTRTTTTTTTACCRCPKCTSTRCFKNFGNGIPRDLFSVQTGFDLFGHRLRINALFDYKGGYSTQDGANNFQCNSAPLRPAARRRIPTAPLGAAGARDRQDVRHDVERHDVQDGAGYFINGQFWKFRELSAVVQAARSRSIALLRAQSGSSSCSARATCTLWTKFTGIDPEANYGLNASEVAERVPDDRRADVLHAPPQSQVLTPSEDDIHDENHAIAPDGRSAAGVVAAALSCSRACSELQGPAARAAEPGLDRPVGGVSSPAAAYALKVGAIGQRAQRRRLRRQQRVSVGGGRQPHRRIPQLRFPEHAAGHRPAVR